MKYNSVIQINKREISIAAPTYFIADIASNHDGKLEQAKELIYAAKEAGADAVKFQHFLADKIVSDYGFQHMIHNVGHQSLWKKSVYEVYKECECNRKWTECLVETAKKAQIDFFTTPYDKVAVDELDPYVPAYKIGSGDITWVDFITYIAKRKKPVLLATGASTMQDVERAVDSILPYNNNIILMQCNTNYTGSLENFKYINLNVLKTFSIRYPGMVLGLSDHTSGHATVLGAVALGARVIEKHFTLDNNLQGPDHGFSMNPKTWKVMVDCTRELENSLGSGVKRVEKNELDTVIVQRRSLCFKHDMRAGQIISAEDLSSLRPAVLGAVLPYEAEKIIGHRLVNPEKAGEAVWKSNVEGVSC